MQGKVQSIQRGLILRFWELSIRCCLTHIPSFMFFLPSSPIFQCQTLQSGGTAAGSHILHSPHPPPPFVFLCSHPYPPSSCAWASGSGPSQLFSSLLLLMLGLPWLLPLPPFYLLGMKPSQTIKYPEVIRITVKLTWRQPIDDGLTGRMLNLWSDAKLCIQSYDFFLCVQIPSPQSCENRMSACSH